LIQAEALGVVAAAFGKTLEVKQRQTILLESANLGRRERIDERAK
jgi:hypothetical protein